MRECRKCTAGVEDGDRHCWNCGTDCGEQSAANSSHAKSRDPKTMSMVEVLKESHRLALDEMSPQKRMQHEAGNRMLKVALIVFAIPCLFIVGCFALVMSSPSPTTVATPPETPEQILHNKIEGQCIEFGQVRQECATAGDYTTCMKIKDSRWQLDVINCTNDGHAII